MTTRAEWEANEKRTNAEAWARATDDEGVTHCERCGSNGHYTKDGKPDIRGLQLSHTREKGSGGTRYMYTAEEKQILCAHCHATSRDLHNLREVL